MQQKIKFRIAKSGLFEHHLKVLALFALRESFQKIYVNFLQHLLR